MPRPGFWWVYVLEREDGSWYTGVSTDPRRRMEQHRAGKGAKANQVSAPQRLVSLEPLGSYPLALRREAQVKALSKAAKRLYAADPGSLPGRPPSPPEKAGPGPKKDPKRAKKRILKG
ncbi:MAG TPA: GIY-YIG nuclease family protein [bacterium]|nr:GIY-YIG nuclease family protein [bacterium]